MNSLFPLVYSIALFVFLFIISFYILKQITNTQKLEKKIFRLQESIKKDNVSYETFYKLGQLYLKKKLFYKAILLFRQALKAWNPNDKIGLGSLYNTIGFTYFTLKQYNLANYYYSIAIEIIPDYTLALTNLGYSYEKLNLSVESYNCYKNALVWDPENRLASSRILVVEKKLRYLVGTR
uniref:Ycf37 n=1 Tax=Lessoniopsis littoralis TaxID=169788 RepID=A0A8F0F9E0_9PHAE|nr:hypothetical protein V2494_pgp021 [Pleurophycus gardneri]QWK42491.1 hypothetical protein [Lessoniopsis littoralis]WAM64506.1 hypothetical protein [Pleurophycus gardneri]